LFAAFTDNIKYGNKKNLYRVYPGDYFWHNGTHSIFTDKTGCRRDLPDWAQP
jgi:hypothetical protein